MKNGLFCLLLLISIYSVHRFSRDVFERTKNKYLDHIKNVQKDLHETRQLLEKDTELKLNQESAYQQLIDERRQLLTRYNSSTFNIAVSAPTPSSTVATVDDLETHPHLISNITFYRQVFYALLLCTLNMYYSHIYAKHSYLYIVANTLLACIDLLFLL
jgi:hypothetical protein